MRGIYSLNADGKRFGVAIILTGFITSLTGPLETYLSLQLPEGMENVRINQNR